MTTWKGTNIFQDFNCAYSYYKKYGFNQKDVLIKIKEEEIAIGKMEFDRQYPGMRPGKFAINREGRYMVMSE